MSKKINFFLASFCFQVLGFGQAAQAKNHECDPDSQVHIKKKHAYRSSSQSAKEKGKSSAKKFLKYLNDHDMKIIETKIAQNYFQITTVPKNKILEKSSKLLTPSKLAKYLFEDKKHTKNKTAWRCKNNSKVTLLENFDGTPADLVHYFKRNELIVKKILEKNKNATVRINKIIVGPKIENHRKKMSSQKLKTIAKK